ncbi:hypothetical protein I350_07362 [Cryptococcus amylolentus CBS 6273]|uniref:CNH domain-containing protein n=1 Tax=Cryptococcus amylolentus CBS 6273 TaxID=1296118 RepID=A0A1E3JEA4_9TREE|nr:hypothetical protein I350_07362 [Cryptococcus amylolentus CBS 6273]
MGSPGARLIAFGNNVCQQLHDGPLMTMPTDVTRAFGDCIEILWWGWNATVYQNASGMLLGRGVPKPLVHEEGGRDQVDAARPVKILGCTHPQAFLNADGYVVAMENGTTSIRSWDDVVVTELGACYAYQKGLGVFYFDTLNHLLLDHNPFGPFKHPLIRQDTPLKLYAAESTVYFLTQHGTCHVLEAIDARALPPALRSTCQDPVQIQLVEELEGLGVTRIVPGSSNRFAALTEAGDAYILAPKIGLELLDVGDDVRLVGVGSDFDVVVTKDKIFVRGSSE